MSKRKSLVFMYLGVAAATAALLVATTARGHAQVIQPLACMAAPTPVVAARTPFKAQAHFTFNGVDDFLTKSFFTVPAGKIFTAEHVAGKFASDSNQTYYVQLTDAATFQGFDWFNVTSAVFQGNQVAQIRTLNQPIRIDFSSGSEIILAVQRKKPIGFTDATVMISGYLTDLPCPRVIESTAR